MNDDVPQYAHRFIPLGDLPGNFRCTDECLACMRDRYSHRVVAALEQLGFRDIEKISPEPSPDTGVWHAPCCEAAPDYLATRDGVPCCICMPPVAGSPLSIAELSTAQCECCEDSYPEHEVYHTALVVKPSKELAMLAPFCVRRDGQWFTDVCTSAQFLPVSLTGMTNPYCATLNGLGYFKMTHIVLPSLLKYDEKFQLHVEGLCNTHTLRNRPWLPIQISCAPVHNGWVCVSHLNPGSQERLFDRPFFHIGGHPEFTRKMELVYPIAGPRPEQGAVCLMDEDGRELRAECLEVIVFLDVIRWEHDYTLNLGMIATSFSKAEDGFDLPSELLLSMQHLGGAVDCACHRKKAAGSPAENDFRMMLQQDNSSDTIICGQIVKLTRDHSAGIYFQWADVICSRGESPIYVRVLLCRQLTEGTELKVGDTITCSGTLQAALHKLHKRKKFSWLDSPEIAHKQAEREREQLVPWLFRKYSTFSLAYGAVVEAYVRAGWELEQVATRNMSRTYPSTVFRNQLGQRLVVLVDVVINGKSGIHTYSSLRRKIEQFCDQLPESTRPILHFATLELTSLPQPDQFKLRATVSPPAEGVQFRELLPGPDALARQELTEEKAAHLLLRGYKYGEWHVLACHQSEDCEYNSHTTFYTCSNKIDYHRYIAEMKEGWDRDEVTYSASFATGYVHDGTRRRPCTLVYFQGTPAIVVIFDVSHGKIRRMTALPEEYFKFIEPNPAP